MSLLFCLYARSTACIHLIRLVSRHLPLKGEGSLPPSGSKKADDCCHLLLFVI